MSIFFRDFHPGIGDLEETERHLRGEYSKLEEKLAEEKGHRDELMRVHLERAQAEFSESKLRQAQEHAAVCERLEEKVGNNLARGRERASAHRSRWAFSSDKLAEEQGHREHREFRLRPFEVMRVGL